MEIFEVNIHTNADDNCLRNVVNYPIKGKEILSKGYGVSPYDTNDAVMQMKKPAEYWENTDKTPICHDVISFTREIAPTAEKALELAEKIFAPYIDDHLTLIGVHEEERGPSAFHTHIVFSPTNINDGSMMNSDNSGLFPIAQRVADITGQKCRLVVKPEDKKKKEYHTVFYPHMQSND